MALRITICPPANADTVVLAVPDPGNLAFLPAYLANATGADLEEGVELKLRKPEM
jgi:hypothetical protein